MLAELFEHYKLQGVEHFYVYIKEMDKYTKKLVDYYVTAGEAEVVTFVSQDIENVIATQVVGFTIGNDWQTFYGKESCLKMIQRLKISSAIVNID
ncbi:hypothetical protein NECAME_12377 [Necator americanus]|uniref:Glycosyltransferase family 92 protein n=1 Tax=Necator americanus TaxID=51031 RepID=W2T2J1_NECAM|nr:hypothetical protein NECAME_12377 [Necator americanus]ETN75451.1 hypothetical protein NECAME_12377 [Necator americanus]